MERGDVSTKGLMLRNTRSPSLSPFPPHYPSTGQRGGGQREVEGRNDIFICSFKGSLLSPFMRNPLFLHLPLSPSFFSSSSATIDSNVSFYTRSLSIFSMSLSLLLSLPPLSVLQYNCMAD